MTLKEALESGKPFRRGNSGGYYVNGHGVAWDLDSVIADDWEIKQAREWFIALNDRGQLLFASDTLDAITGLAASMVKVREVLE